MQTPTTTSSKTWLKLAFITVLALSQSGCILRFVLGSATVDDLGTFIRMQFDDVSVALCRDRSSAGGGIECEYAIETEDGSSDRTSTAELVSQFGVFGIVVDPVIVQVPAGSTVERATVDDGNGPQELRVTTTASFEAQPGITVSAEPGHTFFIVELPEALESTLPEVEPSLGPQFDFDFDFRVPGAPSGFGVPIKAIFAGRVESGGETYYLPLLPCATNLSQVPEFTIPISSNLSGLIFDFLFWFLDNADAGCDNEVFDFTPIDPPPLVCDIDTDTDVDRDDIFAILASRNTPASGPNDPRDIDGDGTITGLDARRCVRECTRPRCATR